MRFRTASLALLLLTACGEDKPALPTEPAPEALFGGCAELSGSVCTLEKPSTITAWLDVHGATPLLVRVDGENIPSTGRIIQGGVRLDVEVPAGATKVAIETTEAVWEPPVELSVTWEEVPAGLAEMSAAEVEALAKDRTGWVQLRAVDLLRRRFQTSKRGPEFRQLELELARKLGAQQHEIWALGSEAHALIQQAGDLDRIRWVLGELERLSGENALAAERWNYYMGEQAYANGDFGTALVHVQESHVLNERINYGLGYVLELEAGTLSELGRDAEARRLATERLRLHEAASKQCDQWIRTVNNIAWVQINLATNGRDHEDPRPLLEDALALSETCPSTDLDGYLRLDLALIELAYGNPRESIEWLYTVDSSDLLLRAWLEEVRSRAAAEDGRQSELLPLVLEPLRTRDTALSWNQQVSIADGLARWGFDELAAIEYRKAETHLATVSERIGSGGDLYLSGRSASLDGLVRVLVRLGRHGEASCAIRLARARELGRLDRTSRLQGSSSRERDAWQEKLSTVSREQDKLAEARAAMWNLSLPEQERAEAGTQRLERSARRELDAALRSIGLEPTPRTCDELRPPRAGEVILTTYWLDGERWVFAASGSRVDVSRDGKLESLVSLASAESITIIEAGRGPHTVPLHSERFGDGTLLDLAPVAYSLDLGPRPAMAATHDSALVVADTRSDLPAAADEADAVSALLARDHGEVVELRGSEATRSALTRHLSSSSILHYAGHGVREGVSGWDSALLLANGEKFGVADVLTLPKAPKGVVLTGCETDAAASSMFSGGINVGRAFILAGSEWVIAADTAVEDEHASSVGIKVHDAPAEDGPTKLRHALIQLRKDDPEVPWEHFRVIVP